MRSSITKSELVLITGPPCIGKTYFSGKYNVNNCFKSLNISVNEQLYDNHSELIELTSQVFRHNPKQFLIGFL